MLYFAPFCDSAICGNNNRHSDYMNDLIIYIQLKLGFPYTSRTQYPDAHICVFISFPLYMFKVLRNDTNVSFQYIFPSAFNFVFVTVTLLFFKEDRRFTCTFYLTEAYRLCFHSHFFFTDFDGEFLLGFPYNQSVQQQSSNSLSPNNILPPPYSTLHRQPLQKMQISVQEQITGANKPKWLERLPYLGTKQIDPEVPTVSLQQLG